MKAIISAALLAACASVSPVKTAQLRSAAPIDANAAFATAISTVQQRFAVVAVDPVRGVFATAPTPIDPSDTTVVSYVVRFAGLHTPPGAQHVAFARQLPIAIGNNMAGLQVRDRIALEVTPVVFVGSEILPPDRIPRAARDMADDLVREIHYREQQNRIIH